MSLRLALYQATRLRGAAPFGFRSISISAVMRKDLVQDLYLKELKAYKPAPEPQDGHVGQVKELKLPKSPEPPKLETDLASELTSYEKEEPTETVSANVNSGIADNYDPLLEIEEPDVPEEAHH